ncbi:hypothetical protein W04_2357 [Pseudoalteromonas sp. SW0106-04]|uniref:type I-F CRISPR-associated protein Csy2 n=1 Tax=Pseudoalteromonas sp. SW0106-04 TaxID=1702169 RepID=UPI0006B442BB|nr:type I-F CRISPR-associated protein Csy2 [Pseudoalteromonas sp. SW0106-04]GAP75818.1 hypothetical protein W04_2357 [Pseudoalteromonas sp. SW0106-04]
MDLAEALAIKSVREKSDALRKLFAPYAPSVVVDGYEHQVATVLINLVYKRNEQIDLTSIKAAKDVLKDTELMAKCISEVKWFHTHNLKYPDIRVSHQRLIAQVIDKDIPAITSASLPKLLGWSHNSAEINHAKLFLTSFKWQGEVNNLAGVLVDEHPAWVEAMRNLGLTKKSVMAIATHIRELLPATDLPGEVSEFTPQLMMPYGKDYLSVSPVVSHAMLARVQQLARDKAVNWGTVEHTRPANVGDLPSSLGGNVRVLRYFPATSLKGSLGEYIENDPNERLFKHKVLTSKSFKTSLIILTGKSVYNTLRQKRLARIAAIRQLRRTLMHWLDKIIEFQNNGNHNLVPEPMKSLIENLKPNLNGVVCELSGLLNEQLSSHHSLKKFAYHPDLMSVLKRQLQYVLMHEETVDETLVDPQILYVHCKGLRIFDAEGMPNPYLQGIPSLTALAGVAHKFQRKLQSIVSPSIECIGSAVFLHSYQLHTGKPLPEQNQLKTNQGITSAKRPGIIDRPKCDMTIDLVFRFFVPHESTRTQLTDNMFKAAFPTSFAGGTMHPPSLYETVEWCQAFTSPTQLFGELSLLPSRGCWLYPSKHQVRTFEDMVELLDADPNQRPAGLGFASLEQPTQRKGALGSKHCYVEPAIGLLECFNPITTRMGGAKAFFHNAFWVIGVEKTSMLMKKAKFEYTQCDSRDI